MSTNKDIAKNASLIGFWTSLSRVLGFIRDVIIARIFGIQVYAQAFVIAFRIPNLFRDLVAEGAANSALVPIFSEYAAKKSREEFWELANVILNLLLVIVSAIVLLGIIFSPLIVRLVAPGFLNDPYKFEMTVRLNRFIFPYLLLVALCAYITAILNTLKHFSVSAFAPCLLNISIIICALVFGEGIKGLVSGVLLGGVLQLAVQLPMLYKKGFKLRHKALADRPRFFSCFKHPAVPVIGKLMLPRLGSSSIYQLNNFVDSIFGSLSGIVGDGGVAVLYFSYRLIQFPLGIFSNALTQAILPALSAQALEASHDKLKATLSWGMRATFFVMLPASVGLMSLALPIIAILFGGGKFGASSVQLTSGALLFYSVGLFAYSGTKILQSGFFSLKDTRTPAKIAGLALIMNILLNSILMFPLKISGLALATSISGINTFIILFIILSKRLGGFNPEDIFYPFIRMLLASLGMGLVSYFVSQKIINLSAPVLSKVISLSFTVFCGVLSYAIFCFIFKVKEAKDVGKWLIARNSKRSVIS